MSTPFTSQAYDELVAAIVAAVPEIGHEHCQCCGNDKCDGSTTGCPWYVGRVPTLEDVLRALDKIRNVGEYYAITCDGIFIERELKTITPRILDGRMLSVGIGWKLGLPLSRQSDECKAFLHSLLCV